MDRRTFLKSVGAAIGGITGLKFLKKEPELTEKVLSDTIEEWRNGTGYITFIGTGNDTMTASLFGFDNQGNYYVIEQKTILDKPQTITLGGCNLNYDRGTWQRI